MVAEKLAQHSSISASFCGKLRRAATQPHNHTTSIVLWGATLCQLSTRGPHNHTMSLCTGGGGGIQPPLHHVNCAPRGGHTVWIVHRGAIQPHYVIVHRGPHTTPTPRQLCTQGGAHNHTTSIVHLGGGTQPHHVNCAPGGGGGTPYELSTGGGGTQPHHIQGQQLFMVLTLQSLDCVDSSQVFAKQHVHMTS